MAKSVTTTEVEIFGTVYSVRGDQDPGHLEALADRVDTTMREIAGKVATADTAKIAILAALNLADELSRCQGQSEGDWKEIAQRMTRLGHDLDEALAGAAT